MAASIIIASVICTEIVSRNYMISFDEFPSEEVRRSYEFPEPLRNKYKEIFGEMDHPGKYIDPTEFHYEGNQHREFADKSHHDH